MSDKGPMTPIEWPLEVGQIWRECDSRFTRYVTVIGWDGDRVQLRDKGRTTWAALRRFHGKSRGYAYTGTFDAKAVEKA